MYMFWHNYDDVAFNWIHYVTNITFPKMVNDVFTPFKLVVSCPNFTL